MSQIKYRLNHWVFPPWTKIELSEDQAGSWTQTRIKFEAQYFRKKKKKRVPIALQCPDLGQSLLGWARHTRGSQKGSLASPLLGCWAGTGLGCQSFLIPPWGTFWFQQISKCSPRSALLLGLVVVGVFYPCYFRCSAAGWGMLHMHKESSTGCRKAINSPGWGGSGWKPSPGKWDVKDSALAWLCAQRCWELCCHWLQQA